MKAFIICSLILLFLSHESMAAQINAALEHKIKQNCQVINIQSQNDHSIVLLECNVPINQSLVNIAAQYPESLKFIESQMQDQLNAKKVELNIWRDRANVDTVICYAITVLSVFISILTLLSGIIIVKFSGIHSEVIKTKDELSKWANFERQYITIQLALIKEYSSQSTSASSYVNVDPMQANILALDIIGKVKLLLSEDITKIENSCNDIPQLISNYPKTKIEINKFIIDLLSSNLISNENIKKRIVKLLNDLQNP